MTRLENRLKNSLFALGLLVASGGDAAQYIEGVDGKAAVARISIRELTLIKVEGGRIQRIRHNPGEIAVEADNDRGEVYIKPLAGGTKPINIFVVTEKSTFPIIAQAVDVPAESIIIRDRGNRNVHNEPTSPYVRAIKNVLLAVTAENPPSGYEIRSFNTPVPLWKETRFILQRSLVGTVWVADHYVLSNITNQQLVLEEQEFFRAGVAAVSVEQLTLSPGEATSVFIIRERAANE